MTRPVALLYRSRPVPRRMTREERIERWMDEHPATEAIVGCLLVAALVAACAYLMLRTEVL